MSDRPWTAAGTCRRRCWRAARPRCRSSRTRSSARAVGRPVRRRGRGRRFANGTSYGLYDYVWTADGARSGGPPPTHRQRGPQHAPAQPRGALRRLQEIGRRARRRLVRAPRVQRAPVDRLVDLAGRACGPTVPKQFRPTRGSRMTFRRLLVVVPATGLDRGRVPATRTILAPQTTTADPAPDRKRAPAPMTTRASGTSKRSARGDGGGDMRPAGPGRRGRDPGRHRGLDQHRDGGRPGIRGPPGTQPGALRRLRGVRRVVQLRRHQRPGDQPHPLRRGDQRLPAPDGDCLRERVRDGGLGRGAGQPLARDGRSLRPGGDLHLAATPEHAGVSGTPKRRRPRAPSSRYRTRQTCSR